MAHALPILLLAWVTQFLQLSLLKPDSPIFNILATLFILFEWISNFSDSVKGDWPNMIVAYAEKNKIEIKGLYNVKELLKTYPSEDLKQADKK